ncbi:MAG: histidine phosphotransferase family protein [Thermohalobaculum sp.]|nr:histidine phosphotransferase family protein [Thermohalobaculum sp.]
MTGATLAGLVAARICHDLVSPVGAIGNAADLIDELSGAPIGEELDLLRQSAARATSMLRLHRLAFGTPGEAGGAMARAELHAMVSAVLAGPRVEMRWSGLDGPALDLGAARAIALMAMAGRCLLGMRGRLGVTLALDADWPAGVAAEGEAAALDAEAEGWLTGRAGPPLPEPRRIELALLPQALAAAHARLALRPAPGSVLLTALPA